MTETIPIIDLFAGPGGLGEGFSALRASDASPVYKIALSIEMDEAAHRTLELRSFFRQFAASTVPDEYYLHLQGRLSREDLFDKYPIQSSRAKSEAWNAEIGKVDPSEVDWRIKSALAGAPLWVLCGGPPCQAYSVIGRSRNGGIHAKDHRVYLYREYLRILAVHRPPIFILENVKGLLSAKVGGNAIFKQMMTDLGQPHRAIDSRSRSAARYLLYSLVVPPRTQNSDGPEFDFRDFIIKCEDYGIPQSRHRVILLGVREDLSPSETPTLITSGQQVSVAQVLSGLPRLRSGLSRAKDGREEWRQALTGIVTPGVLDSIPNGKGPELRSIIGWTIRRIRDARADRGGEFVACKPTSDYRPDWYCDERIGGVCNHASRPHMKEDLYRYLFVACYARMFGRSPELRDFSPGLLPKHKNVLDKDKEKYFDDRFRVQLIDKPATTIVSHIAKDGHYYIHYDETQCRSLTVREAARLQTFPDNYLFCGSRTEQYVQVGNAVPPLLAVQIAEVVAWMLLQHSASKKPTNNSAEVRLSLTTERPVEVGC
jgi:DNA (cytosine-5)-methyltransferase 1